MFTHPMTYWYILQNIYFPALIIVTVGPLPSHHEWNVLAAQPSTDARQQCFQREFMPLATGAGQLPNEVK